MVRGFDRFSNTDETPEVFRGAKNIKLMMAITVTVREVFTAFWRPVFRASGMFIIVGLLRLGPVRFVITNICLSEAG